MRSIYDDVRRRGGVAATGELLRDGHTSHALTAAVRSGEVIRIRQGHYGVPELPDAEQQAFRVGGRLGGASGARWHGIWAPRPQRLEVTVKADARALRTWTDPRKRLRDSSAPRTRVRWRDDGRPGTRTVLSAVECVLEVVRDYDERAAFACVESALHLGHLSRARWARERSRLPLDRARRLANAARLSESGGESYFRFELDELAIDYEQQARFGGVGRVDFLVEKRLIIEIDGADFHTSPEAFEEDRRRDALLAARGYRVLRFSYRQVTERWPEVEAALLAALAELAG
jgi:very-short-patch-repair endonuclease